MTKRNNLLIFILTIGVFGILNTEMGVIGILPSLADHYNVSVSQAGLLVSLFALGIAISGPTMPLLFSGIDRKKVMLLVLGVFVLGNIVAIFTTNFTVALIARIIPAFFHPVYCSLAFSVAASAVRKEEATKAVSKVFIGVSAGMVVGVPIVSFIANVVSIEMAMAFFAMVNALVFIVTLLFVPPNTITFTLFLYGGANIIGNIVAGKLLAKNAIKSVVAFPFILGAVYIILFLTGQFTVPMAILTFVWGILAGIGANINQFWIVSSAPEAPDFANGLFLTSANLGVTFGAAVGGFFISEMGTQYVVLVGILSLILSMVTIFLRNYKYSRTKQLSI